MSQSGKKTIGSDLEYRQALFTLRKYFGNPPPFFEPQWREMTYLLQAVCKYEIQVLGLKPKWDKQESQKQFADKWGEVS